MDAVMLQVLPVAMACVSAWRFSRRPRAWLGVLITAGIVALPDAAVAAGSDGNSHTLIASIGISILAATVCAFLAHAARQPLLLAYIAAGVLIGPQMGFGLVHSKADIQVISEIGLIILLFMIGLEIDMKKLKESGQSLILSGLLQFLLCTALGLGVFALLGYGIGNGTYDLLYLAVCCALSSTTIVVKLLYGKYELDTLAGRITLGILVFQDIWAIVILGVQPNLAHPDVIQILWSFAKGGLLVVASMLASGYLLPPLFKTVAKLPEIVLVASLGWCFFVAGAANALGLSLEMGALIAGVTISTFPYNLDVIAKIVSIRDFFITLFFVALGMGIPNPLHTLSILAIALAAALFLIASRFLAVYPLLYALRNGHRVSLLTTINLAQMSEFSLVIAAIGVTAGHIDTQILSIMLFVFVITSIVSTYMIQYSNPLQKRISRWLHHIGLRDIAIHPDEAMGSPAAARPIALLGFFRVASSFLHELQAGENQEEHPTSSLKKEQVFVLDFNPEVHSKLRALGMQAIYGDISHMETLHHAGVHAAKVAISTVPDNILVGTDNLQMIEQIQTICPQAKIVVTAESPKRALAMYAEGADYVLVPRILAAQHLRHVVEMLLSEDVEAIVQLKQAHLDQLQRREEVVS
jgi:Kef-type K+ transport system membrane component KefB